MKNYLRVLEAIESAGAQAWLVGDPVREVAMGIHPLNLSVVVAPCALETLAKSLGGDSTVRNEAHPVLRATVQGSKVEIFCMRGESIEDDLALRDFSMNAIAIRSDGAFVDPYGGRHDIRNRLVRITGDDMSLIKNDPIRIVRMLRFAAELDMAIFWKSESDVRAFIANQADEIADTPPERWGREIVSGMRRRPYDFIYLADRYHLLPFFLKDIERLKEIYIEDDQTLFDHTLDTLRVVQSFLLGRKRRENDMAFALLALFHHVGSQVNQPGDTQKASEIADEYLKAWNVGAEVVDEVVSGVKNYRLPYSPLDEEELCRWGLKHGFSTLEMIVDFSVCNARADGMKNIEVLVANKWKLGEVLRRFDEAKRRTEGSPRYLSGDEVMATLDLQPGKAVGDILEELDMAVGTGIVHSKKEATDWVLRRARGK